MKTLDIQFGVLSANKSDNLTLPQLNAMVDESILILESMVSTNRAYLNNPASTYYAMYGQYDKQLKKYGTTKFTVEAKRGGVLKYAFADEGTVAALSLIRKCYDFKAAAALADSADKPLKGYALRLTSQTPNEVAFESIYSLADACCKECNKLISAGSMSKHVGSYTCVLDKLDAKLKIERDFVRVADTRLAHALAKAGIDFERHPLQYGTWAPTWVNSAFKTYVDNHGFAGLSLAEYLKKVKPQ